MLLFVVVYNKDMQTTLSDLLICLSKLKIKNNLMIKHRTHKVLEILICRVEIEF